MLNSTNSVPGAPSHPVHTPWLNNYWYTPVLVYPMLPTQGTLPVCFLLLIVTQSTTLAFIPLVLCANRVLYAYRVLGFSLVLTGPARLDVCLGVVHHGRPPISCHLDVTNGRLHLEMPAFIAGMECGKDLGTCPLVRLPQFEIRTKLK